ncbi:MAG: inositol monophosphatase family protein, partial [Sneathiella sp.]
MTLDRGALTTAITDIAIEAGDIILEVYNSDFDVNTKGDSSPVTKADVAAEEIILKGLLALTPDIPVLAEESVDAGRIPDLSGGIFWLVD